MSLIDVKIELGFNEGTFGQALFTLDSETDSILGTSQLAGTTFYDVSSYVTAVSVTRGRSRQLDYFNAGVATITFNNRDRAFDPTNMASPYYPSVVPRVLVRITAKGYPVFYGSVNDWDLNYDIANNDVVIAYCSDPFMVFSNQSLRAFTPSAELTGVRINTVLNRSEVNYKGGRDIDAGLSTLGAYAVAAGTNVLNYLRQVERSEAGYLFGLADGTITFVQRGLVPNADRLKFTDDGTGLPYQNLLNQYGDELLYNYVVCESPAGAEQVKSDTTSINKYQISELTYSDLLNSTTAEVANVAAYLLQKYKDPKLRFTGFSVQLSGLTDTQKGQVLGTEILDFIDVKKSFQVGTPTSKTLTCYVSGISHEIRPDNHVVTFSVESSENSLILILGDTLAGTLDNNLLDF